MSWVIPIETPPLRKRGSDLDLLARHFLARMNSAEGTNKRLSFDSLAYLHEHDWPGNVRELYNNVQRAFILADQELDLRSATTYGPCMDAPPHDDGAVTFRPGMSLSEVERMVAACRSSGIFMSLPLA